MTAPVRRLVCVAPNPSVDKIVAVDELRPGAIHRPEVLSVVPGGKGLNVARPAATLGVPVVVIALLGGHAGAWIADGLATEGVALAATWFAGETRECLSILDRASGRLTELYEPGARVDEDAWAAIERALADALRDDAAGTLVALSGSLPAGAPADGHARIVRLARAAGARAIVDAGGAGLARALPERPWLAKANEAEAADATGVATGTEAGALAAARILRERGAVAALVTRGMDGAVLVDADGVAWRVGAPPERGAFPVGSGDTLVGGLVAALADGAALPEAVRRGTAAAAANALAPGQGRIEPAEVARLLPGITLERLPG